MDQFNLFDPEGVESELMEEYADELNNIGGAPCQYYHLAGGQQKNRYHELVDKVYEEPIEIILQMQDVEVTSELSKWGIDDQLDYLISVPMKLVKEKLRKMPRKGDKIRRWDGEEIVVLDAIKQANSHREYHAHHVFITAKRMLPEDNAEAQDDNLGPDESPDQFNFT